MENPAVIAYLLVGFVLALLAFVASKSLRESGHPWITLFSLAIFAIFWLPFVAGVIVQSTRKALKELKEEKEKND